MGGKYATIYECAVGDLKPDITHVILDEVGNPQDLTAADSVDFFLWNHTTKAYALEDQAATIVTAATGDVKYVWSSGQTDTAGRYIGFFRVFWVSGDNSPMTPKAFWVLIGEPYERLVVP